MYLTIPSKKRKARTPAQKEAHNATTRLSRLRCQSQNTSETAAPPRNPAAASATADLPSAMGNNLEFIPANGSSEQSSIRPAMISNPVPKTQRLLQKYRHSSRRQMGMDSNTLISVPCFPVPALCHSESTRRTLLTRTAPDPLINVLNIQENADLAVPPILNEGKLI